MTIANSSYSPSTFSWWEARRIRYNIGLIIAGITAFICYVGAEAVLDTGAEITVVWVIFDAFGYLFMMLIANICYFLGPVAEKLLRPKDVDRFRKVAYGLGFWFSCALPFSIPLTAPFSVEITTFLRRITMQ